KLTASTTIKAVAISPLGEASHTVEGSFFKINLSWDIDIKSKCSRQYTAGGPEGLIDGIRGAANFRLGGWQGYQNQDFEAVVDLGSVQPISRLAAGFHQDARSWIMMPKCVEFWVSHDGQQFTLAATVGHTVADNNMEPVSADLSASVTSSGRYVKVVARNYGALPQWHLGAGFPAFIFIDEIMVE
ncbi:MAG: discoidin domain-containing protein, partial [Tenuifilaceae bacterium]|nr:discoidin domain-containing protein [Tenuifilaceae bacterium]